jgi:hypothetical protein
MSYSRVTGERVESIDQEETMGFLKQAVVGRWLARWLMRGSPLAVVAKLAAVGAFGAWRYHRQRKRSAAYDQKQIDADYEILGPDRIAPTARPEMEPGGKAQGTPAPEVHEDPTMTA